MSDILEKQIVDLLASRNHDEAFRIIVSGYKERLYWHIRNMVLSHDDTDDLLQDTFVKVWKKLSKFEGRSQVYSWLFRIATNETLTFLAQKKKRHASSMDDERNDVSRYLKADEYFDGEYAQAILLEAVQSLPDKQRIVFTMKYFQEMKYDEISAVLETSVGALKASYHHAVKKVEGYVKLKVE